MITKDLIVRFSPDEHTNLKIICALKGESMNDVVRKLVREYIDQNQAKVA